MKTYSRTDRVSGEIHKIISGLIQKDIKDPRLGMVTITGVKMSPDLRHARIYFVITGGKLKSDDATQGFQSATGFIKKAISRQLDLRYIPHLSFFYDESFDYGDRIDNMLKQLVVTNGSDHQPLE
jgi:ribosome-binding factor A